MARSALVCAILGLINVTVCRQDARGDDSGSEDGSPPSVDLARLDSGSEEVALVDQLYPEAGNQEMRRLALERALEYFPNDRTTVFRIEVRLAVLDWNAGRAERAHERLTKALASGSGKIERGAYSWAEVVDGRILGDLGRQDEALARLDRVALDHSMPSERRVEAAEFAADLRAIGSPEAALDWLEEACSRDRLGGPVIEANIARLMLVTGQTDELSQRLAGLADDHSKGEGALVDVLEAARGWNKPGDAERLLKLVDIVADIRTDAGSALRNEIDRLRAEQTVFPLQIKLDGLLGVKPLSNWILKVSRDPHTPLEDFSKAIGEATRRSDPERCLRLSLRALASHRDAKYLPKLLWQAASFADWVERTKPQAIDPQVATKLLGLCDQLPPSNAYFIEGKFLAAQRYSRKGDNLHEQAVLKEILSQPNLPAIYMAPASRALGSNLESTGKYRQALEVYQSVENLVTTHTAAARCGLHAAWINLSLGNDIEAERLIRLLAQAPASVIKPIPGEAQLRELEALVRTGRAAECWGAGRVWWSEWVKIAVTLGAPTDLQAYGVPEIASTSQLEDSIRHAIKTGDNAAYLNGFSILMSAARWHPSLVPEAAGLSAMAVRLAAGSGDDLRGMLIRMLAGPHPPEIPGLRERKLCLAINFLDAHHSADALKVAAEFSSTRQPEDNTARAMHRVRALAALSADRDYAASAAELETDLADPGANVQRAMAVGLLSDIYLRLGRSDDSAALLRREVDNPSVAGDPPGRASLRSRLANIGRPKSGRPPVSRWIEAAGLDWYAYAEPENLDDPRLASLGDAIENADRIFEPVEQAKLYLLAADDTKRSPDECNRLFLQAAVRIIDWAGDYERLDALAASVVNEGSFDRQVRLGVLWNVLTILAREGRADDYRSWEKNELCDQLGPDFKAMLALLDREVGLDRSSVQAIMGLAEEAGSRELTPSRVLILRDCLDYLLRSGEVGAAEGLGAKLQSWKFSNEIASSADAVHLEFARGIRVAQSINPVHEALAAAALAGFPGWPDTMPEDYSNLRIGSRVPTRGPRATFDACLRLIAGHEFPREDLQFWGTFLGSILSGNGPAIGALLRSALKAAPSDELRSQLIVLFFSSLDVDEPLVRAEMERAFAPYRRSVECPLSYLTVRLYEIHRDLRLGKAPSLDTAFLDLDDPRALFVRQRTCLRYYTQIRSLDDLRKTVDQIEPVRLLTPEFLTQAIPALEILKSESELKTAKEAASRLLRKEILESWARGNESAGNSALDLILALGSGDVLPPAWVKAVSTRPGDPLFKARLMLTQAYLDSHWGEVERVAATLNKDYPNRYVYYWYRSLALHHLGREREAADCLAPFLEHAKDDPDFPRAVELARTIGRSGAAKS